MEEKWRLLGEIRDLQVRLRNCSEDDEENRRLTELIRNLKGRTLRIGDISVDKDCDDIDAILDCGIYPVPSEGNEKIISFSIISRSPTDPHDSIIRIENSYCSDKEIEI